MSPLEIKLCSELERGLPISERPFAQLSLPEDEALAACRRLLVAGFIRRIGAFVDYRAVGLEGYLVGVAAQPEFICPRLDVLPAVTHIYQREGRLNIWFTAIGEKSSPLAQLLGDLGLPYVILSSLQRLKLRPSFAASDHDEGAAEEGPLPAAVCLSPSDRVRLHALQTNFQVTRFPFRAIAEDLGESEEELLSKLHSYRASGVVRRVGAALRHNRLGYVANSLLAWEADDDRVQKILPLLREPWLSHCYLRGVEGSSPDIIWRQNLFAMIHAKTLPELEERRRLLTAAVGREAVSMKTLAEFKKSSFIIAPF